MKDKNKDRDQTKARKRARNDAQCAIRKLQQWALDLGDVQSSRSLKEALELVQCSADRLARGKDSGESRKVA